MPVVPKTNFKKFLSNFFGKMSLPQTFYFSISNYWYKLTLVGSGPSHTLTHPLAPLFNLSFFSPQPLPTVHCALGDCPLCTGHWPLSSAQCQRPTVHWQRPTAFCNCPHPTAYCPQSTAHCLLPTAQWGKGTELKMTEWKTTVCVYRLHLKVALPRSKRLI